MKRCPRCNQLIGDEVTECPNCQTKFTEKQLEEMKKDAESYEVQKMIREHEKMKRFFRKRVIMGVLMFSGLGLAFFSTPIYLSKLTTLGFIVLISGGVLFVGGLIFGFISGATNCPHCGALLFRNYGNHCAYCGKKYR